MSSPNERMASFAQDARPVVLLSGSSSTARGIAAYYKNNFAAGGLVIVEERPPTKGKLLQFIRRRARNRGWLSVVDAIAGRLVQALIQRWFMRHINDDAAVPDLIVATCNDPAIPRLVESINARVVILNLCSVVSEPQLAAIARPIINVHPGINPRYRGAGNVWAMSEGHFDLVGATIHFVDAGIDTGPVIAYVPVNPVNAHLGVEDTFTTAQRLGAAAAINIVNGGECRPVPVAFQNLTSRFYPYPGLTTWMRAWLNLKLAQRKSARLATPPDVGLSQPVHDDR